MVAMADADSSWHLRAQAVAAYTKSRGQIDILTYPEGEGERDTVTITDSDMDGLQPGKYLRDNIIDFYIKYLQKTGLSSTDRDRLYFFNSFFFTKLLESSSASADSGECRVDYGQLQKWTQGVDLFEKEYIFIPVIHRSHWSLILICHLTSLNRRHEESKPLPCIYHLDSMSGTHESFEREVKSYLLEAWLDEKFEGADKDQVGGMTRAWTSMRYVQPKVPQQDNGYDCGLYLMHYVEDILEALKSNALSLSSKQLETCFVERRPSDVNEKRVFIKNLILQRSGVKEVTLYLKPHENEGKSIYNKDSIDSFTVFTEDDHAQQAKVGDIVEHEEGQGDVKAKRVLSETDLNHDVAIEHVEDEKVNKIEREQLGQSESLQCTIISDDPVNSQHDEQLDDEDIKPLQARDLRNVKSRDMLKNETGVLLDCMVEGGVYFNEKKNATCWDKISERIEESCRTKLTKKQCQGRFDTLKKAYRVMKVEFCEKHNKSFSESTEKERENLRLATSLCEEWYEKIGEICEKREKQEKIRKSQCRQSLKREAPKRRKSILSSENGQDSEIEILPTMARNLEEDFAIAKHQVGCSRSSKARLGDWEEGRFQLSFKNKLALPIFTSDMLTSENCNTLIVNLEDVDTGEIVRTGPWAFVELEVVVLRSGLTSDVEGNWTQQVFEEHILGDMLSGERDIKLMDGEGYLGELFFSLQKYNYSFLRVELGVRVSPRSCVGFRIQEARTQAFEVIPSWEKYQYKPTLGSEVWTLQNIRKWGPIHRDCIDMRIFTVEEFLRQEAMGNALTCDEDMEETWDHAMTCKPSGMVRRYESDGCGIVFNHLFQAIGLMEENGPFRDAQSLSFSEMFFMVTRTPGAVRSWKHVELAEELILPKMATER